MDVWFENMCIYFSLWHQPSVSVSSPNIYPLTFAPMSHACSVPQLKVLFFFRVSLVSSTLVHNQVCSAFEVSPWAPPSLRKGLILATDLLREHSLQNFTVFNLAPYEFLLACCLLVLCVQGLAPLTQVSCYSESNSYTIYGNYLHVHPHIYTYTYPSMYM